VNRKKSDEKWAIRRTYSIHTVPPTAKTDLEDEENDVLQPLEPEWSSELEATETPPFLCEVGPTHNLRRTDNEKSFFELIFDENCVRILTEGTNKYSRERQQVTGRVKIIYIVREQIYSLCIVHLYASAIHKYSILPYVYE
jgi:hypothetical protein